MLARIMVRRLAVLVLAVPLALNGLWVVCRDGAPQPAAERSGVSAEHPHCSTTMCVLEKAQNSGPICILTSDENKVSLTIFVFGIAVIPLQVSLPRPSTEYQVSAERASFYLDPIQSVAAPPPEV